MTVGFVMLAHTSLNRAAQVATVISNAGCPVAIHVDARVGASFDAFRGKVSNLVDVRLEPRLACEWGTWSLVEASFRAAERLLFDYPNLTHVYLISGACLPIRPISELVSYLAEHKDTDFIESVTIEEVPWTQGGLGEERFTLTFPFSWRRSRKLFDFWVEVQRRVGRRRRIPTGLKPHMGSQWWCLTRDTLRAIADDPRRRQLERYFRSVWIPDESYFQSLVRLYGRKVESRSLTLSKFDYQGKPHVFYDDHLVLLRQSQLFFARKIWPEANRLYRAFLQGRNVTEPVPQMSAAQIDRTFTQASLRRKHGRAGLVSVGGCPKPDNGHALTAAPYAAFCGYSDLFHDFARWVRANSQSRTHGHLFARDRVQYYGGQSGYAGAMSNSAALRDYDPEQFLRNLIWNTRGEHQSFLFSARDAQGITKVLAKDRNATITLVTGAWTLPLLRSGKPVDAVRAEAAILQQREADFVELLNDRNMRASARIWTLAEFLENPLDPLQDILDRLTRAEPQNLTASPSLKSMEGLPEFLQALRNAGMNPYIAGEVTQELAEVAQVFDVTQVG